jgi:hypothetical protein
LFLIAALAQQLEVLQLAANDAAGTLNARGDTLETHL